MKIKALGHVVLKVRDLSRSVPFYTDILGLKEVGRYEKDFRLVFFSISGNHHDLALFETAPDAPSAPEQSPGLFHVALKVGDSLDELRSTKTWLESNGVKIDMIADHHVSQSLYFSDPDGNAIELFVDGDPQIWKDNPGAVATLEPLTL
jgi:catechol 2,3-dioxygenase